MTNNSVGFTDRLKSAYREATRPFRVEDFVAIMQLLKTKLDQTPGFDASEAPYVEFPKRSDEKTEVVFGARPYGLKSGPYAYQYSLLLWDDISGHPSECVVSEQSLRNGTPIKYQNDCSCDPVHPVWASSLVGIVADYFSRAVKPEHREIVTKALQESREQYYPSSMLQRAIGGFNNPSLEEPNPATR